MLFKTSPEKFWNLIASKYAASPIAERQAYEAKIQKLKTFLSQDQVVLDIGCGTGTQCNDIAASVNKVVGIDISRKLLAIAAQRKAERQVDNVEFMQASVYDERLTPGSFDVVMAFYILHLLDDPDAVFARIHKLLKPGGLFISETACLGGKSKITNAVLGLLGKVGLLPKINILTTAQLEQALTRQGFHLLEKTKFGQRADAEFTLIARKI